ncbi:peptide chain release factor N(5)-glutamine methyltransferase [Candidatus Methylopumilus universalis]|uniref:peptide chain release factor N(5)-glutamine methyltransferase n=1 Tax=Candidatus Methylopumilus universalis TaxID=2588536 RepID=A0AAX1F171_9PROT|nr:peptide chain release factor N(5)-glutamine methyltransferase [Candidatus Methylopumilus universalis]QDC41600.1 peptide chain release factor N(5)-glutamine methyltransferase [Candidatus Methylopumilus universalis]QDC42881.1 peptide chain release factor N(5)-glutamine methyltransferase [Candidatus Methylopumilus universalis]QDC55270.1 peptide chain release factor N(5)-glutamine methyltransferase [Candidatus Methylopumilus universalis]QDC56549.1 peptide chain release factor N(5)-glutamine meth
MATIRDTLKNIQSKLYQGIGFSSDEAKLEARFILEHVLKITQKEIIQQSDLHIDTDNQTEIEYITEKRIAGTPLPYLLGEWSFYGRTFKVNPHVLIPRADTEILIEKALSKINVRDRYEVLDLGCGTGIIGITIALERPLSKVTLIDQSEHAIQNTKENQTFYQVTNTMIQKSDWFSALDQIRFDVILSNPPYLEDNDPHLSQGLEEEPLDALVSGPTGIEAIQYIIENAKNHIKPSGWLFIEHGYNQAMILKDLFEKNGYQHIENANDIHGIHRVTFAQYSIV